MTIITADLGSLRAFRVVSNENKVENPNAILQEIDVSALPSPPQRLSDTVSDKAGRFRSDGSPGLARGEAHGLEQEQERKCIADLAAAIEDLLSNENSEVWSLSAPKTINGRLVDMISQRSRQRLRENLLINLCKQPILEIQNRFKLPQVT